MIGAKNRPLFWKVGSYARPAWSRSHASRLPSWDKEIIA
jgi:hypothetical protein